MSSDRDLVSVHRALHAALRATLEEALMAATEATATALAAAARRWDQVIATIAAHAEDEEAALATLTTPLPRGGDTALIVAEHRKLDALLVAGRDALDRIAAAAPAEQRRTLVRELDTLLRAVHLFEHHSEREERIVYPHLVDAAGLAPEARAVLARRITERATGVVGALARANGAPDSGSRGGAPDLASD